MRAGETTVGWYWPNEAEVLWSCDDSVWDERWTKRIFKWIPPERRKRERPRQSWNGECYKTWKRKMSWIDMDDAWERGDCETLYKWREEEEIDKEDWTELKKIMDEIEERRLRWYGQVRRMEDGRLRKAAQNWDIARSSRRRELYLTTQDLSLIHI